MQNCDFGYQPAIHLFRPGRVNVASPQTCFDMRHRDFLVEGGKCSGKGRRGIALNDQPIRLQLLQIRLQSGEYPYCHIGQGLPGLHDIKIDIRLEPENFQNLRRHFPMLPGIAQHDLDIRPTLGRKNERQELDSLRACPKDDKNRNFSQNTLLGNQVPVTLLQKKTPKLLQPAHRPKPLQEILRIPGQRKSPRGSAMPVQ